MLDENFATVWEALADRMPEHAGIVQGDRHLALGEWERRAARLAGALQDHGIGPGDKVGMVLHNCPEFYEVLFAAFKLRAVPVAFNFRFRGRELQEVLDDSDSKVVFLHGSILAEAEGIKDDLPDVGWWVHVPDGHGEASWTTPYAEAVEHEPAARLERSGEDLFIQYTGGTTGRPKGVMWRHRDISSVVAFLAYLPIGVEPPDDIDTVVRIAAEQHEGGTPGIFLPSVPLMHGSGLYGSFSYLQVAGKVVLLEGRTFDAAEFCRAVAEHGVTQTVIVGDVFAGPIADELDRAREAGEPWELPSLGMITSGGLTFSQDVKARLMANLPHLTILDAVGSSEGGPWGMSLTFAGTEPDETARFTATGDTVLIDPDTGEVMPFGTGAPGLIGFRGPQPLGYYKDDAKTDESFRTIDGVRHAVTGDLAMIDADGTMTFLGRGNTCINTGGEKVFPDEVEAVIKEHPDVDDCIVVGVPDEQWGSAICAIVAPSTSSSELTLEVVAAHVKDQLAGFKQPRRLLTVPEVQRTAVGKPDYRWANQVAAEALSSR